MDLATLLCVVFAVGLVAFEVGRYQERKIKEEKLDFLVKTINRRHKDEDDK